VIPENLVMSNSTWREPASIALFCASIFLFLLGNKDFASLMAMLYLFFIDKINYRAIYL